MNRPRILTYVFGNPFTCLLVLCLTGKLFYDVQTNPPDSNSVGLINIMIGGALLMVGLSVGSFWQVHRYERWKNPRTTIAEDPKEKSQLNRYYGRYLLIIGAAVWCALVYWFSFFPHASDQEEIYTLGSYIFVFITLAALVCFSIWLFLRLRLRNKARQSVKEKNYIVNVSLPVPSSSPEPQQITASLPSYCHSLLKLQ